MRVSLRYGAAGKHFPAQSLLVRCSHRATVVVYSPLNQAVGRAPFYLNDALADHAVNWISILVSAAVGGMFGYASARIQELQKNRRRLRSLAGALRQDSQRIRGELGEPGDNYVESQLYGTVPAPVSVHPWTERLIADAAEISPALVGEYMTLERVLGNFNLFRGQLRETLGAIANLEDGARQAESEGVAGVTSLVRARHLLKESQEVALAKHRIVVAARKRAASALDEIDRLLAPYTKS